MKTLILNLVTTNAGWLARQAVKFSAVAAAVITGWLVGKGLDTTHAGVIGAGVASALLGGVELVLSWVARKYAVPELDGVQAAIDAAKKTGTVVLVACLGVLTLASCAQMKTLWASVPVQQMVVTAKSLGAQLAKAEAETVLQAGIDKGNAQIAALTAQGTSGTAVEIEAREAEIIALQVVVATAQAKLAALKSAGKQPVPAVAPVSP